MTVIIKSIKKKAFVGKGESNVTIDEKWVQHERRNIYSKITNEREEEEEEKHFIFGLISVIQKLLGE